jgi:hypothetical protein
MGNLLECHGTNIEAIECYLATAGGKTEWGVYWSVTGQILRL